MDLQQHGEGAAPSTIDASENFIRDLDLGLRHEPGRSTLTAEIGTAPCDAGLMATLVDVIGSHIVMRERPGHLLATTHIELHGIDRLDGPGELVAQGRIIASSKRRSVVEVTIRLGRLAALSHLGFAVRADPTVGDNRGELLRSGRAIDTPLWERLEIESTPTGAAISVGPYAHNHVGALQGGATGALLERGALVGAPAGARVVDAAINYLAQARSHRIHTVTTADLGEVRSVDCIGEGQTAPFARGVFRIR